MVKCLFVPKLSEHEIPAAAEETKFKRIKKHMKILISNCT